VEAIAGFLFSFIIAVAVGIISAVLGLFFGHIILFDSIALGIMAGLVSKNFLPVHPAFSLIIGIVVFALLFLVQKTKFGFWIVGGFLSFAWGFIITIFVYSSTGGDMIWTYVGWGLGAIFMMILHLIAKNK